MRILLPCHSLHPLRAYDVHDLWGLLLFLPPRLIRFSLSRRFGRALFAAWPRMLLQEFDELQRFQIACKQNARIPLLTDIMYLTLVLRVDQASLDQWSFIAANIYWLGLGCTVSNDSLSTRMCQSS